MSGSFTLSVKSQGIVREILGQITVITFMSVQTPIFKRAYWWRYIFDGLLLLHCIAFYTTITATFHFNTVIILETELFCRAYGMN